MIKQAEFITSAANQKGWIDDETPEVCFIGRSNVGKSSFINALTNRNKLAKTSSTPGKTRLLNFFDINKSLFRIVDAPGYGFAKVNFELKKQFSEMMEDYLVNRKNLKFVCQLVDLRHKPTNDDVEMYNFFKFYRMPVLIVATKLDKVKRNDIKKNEKIIKQTLNLHEKDEYISVSSDSKENLDKIYEIFIRKFNLK